MQPQRIRVRGDENIPPASQGGKVIHQRNKSTPALSVMAQNAKNGARRAFGDVSNTKDLGRFSRDDSAIHGKSNIQVVESKAPLAQPAQRPLSISGIKGLLNNVTTKPMNPAGKAQKPQSLRRNNTVFRDQHLEPVTERESSKEVTQPARRRASSVETKAVKKNEAPKEEPVIVEEPRAEVEKTEVRERDAHKSAGSDSTLSDHEETHTSSQYTKLSTVPESLSNSVVAVASELEAEDWEDDEVDYLPPYLSRADNTTGGTTNVIFPRITSMTKRQMLQAKSIVDEARTEEEIIEDFFDSSMVAEYSSEIFLYLRQKEVCSICLHYWYLSLRFSQY